LDSSVYTHSGAFTRHANDQQQLVFWYLVSNIGMCAFMLFKPSIFYFLHNLCLHVGSALVVVKQLALSSTYMYYSLVYLMCCMCIVYLLLKLKLFIYDQHQRLWDIKPSMGVIVHKQSTRGDIQ
jgi:hypothetical protein